MGIQNWLGLPSKNPASPPPGPPQASTGLLGWIRRKFGGWAGPQAGLQTEAGEELTSEKVRSGPQGIVIPWMPRYYDPMGPGPPPEAIRRMMNDSAVKPALLGKLFGVASLDVQIRPANKKDPYARRVAAFAEWQLTEKYLPGVPGLIWNIASGGLIDGYSICEPVLQPERQGKWAGQIVMTDFKALDVGYDVVPETDDHRNIVSLLGLRYNAATRFDPAEFCIWRHLPFYNQPTGTSDLRAAYADWWELTAVRKLRMAMANNRAVPMLKGEYATTSQKPSLEQALAAAKSSNWISVPKGVLITVLEMAGQSEAIFVQYEKDRVHSIFRSIQGAVLQVLEGMTQDGRGNSKTHKSMADLFKWYLSSEMAQVINKLMRDLIDLNFVVQEYPKLTLSAVEAGDLVAELAIDTGLHTMGIPLSLEETYDRYGRTPPEDPQDVLPGAPQQPGGGGSPKPPSQMDDAAQAGNGIADRVGITTGKLNPLFVHQNRFAKQDEEDAQSDDRPATGVAGAEDFRGYSEAWKQYLRQS